MILYVTLMKLEMIMHDVGFLILALWIEYFFIFYFFGIFFFFAFFDIFHVCP